MQSTTHGRATRFLAGSGLNWGAGSDRIPSRREQGLGLGALSCGAPRGCPSYSMGCSSLESYRADQTTYQPTFISDGSFWSPGSWLKSSEPMPSGISPGTGRPWQTFELPCDSLYRFKRLDRPDRYLPDALLNDQGDPYSPAAGQMRDLRRWSNYQARRAAEHGFEWSFPRPDIRARSFVGTLRRSDPQTKGPLEEYPWDLPAQYSRLRHVTEATAAPLGGIEALRKLPIEDAEALQQCATPFPSAAGFAFSKGSAFVGSKRTQAPSGWFQRELGPMDSAEDADRVGTKVSLRDELGTSLAPGRTFY